MRPRLYGFTLFMVIVLVLTALGIALIHELNQPLEVLLPTFEVIDVSPADFIDLSVLGIR